MKTLKITILAAVLALGISCRKEGEKTTIDQQEQGTLPAVKNDTVLPDTTGKPVGDAANPAAKTWAGNYAGSLPCGDCKGIMTKITLNADKTYALSSQYIGKQEKPTNYKGNFNLDDKKNIVTLDAEGDHLKFLLMPEDDMIVKLDKFGNEEQGAQPARYYLHRVM